MKDNCIFCKIIRGEIQSFKIYEDEFTYSFLDLSNDGNGHILVIPKKHCENVFDCDEETLAHVSKTIKKISMHLIEKCGFSGVNILNSSGASAEQTVFHLHFHILPRKDDDDMSVSPKLDRCLYSNEQLYRMLRIEE